MELPGLISRYAERFTQLATGGHTIGSPLGAWLVLAVAAAPDSASPDVADALGTDPATARALADALLGQPHPAVAAALAAWTAPGLTGLDTWQHSIPTAAASGPIPEQRAADAWAHEHTFGLIERFPLTVEGAVILLASALATKVSWRNPFRLVEASELRSDWSERVTHALGTPPNWHECRIIDTDRAGRVAVHSATSADALEVSSVIADRAVAPADVLVAAHQIVGDEPPPALSLFDLPLQNTPIWTISEESGRNRGERVDAVLPAWHAQSQHDLRPEAGLGLAAALRELAARAATTGPLDAAQSATARYTRLGFEAAAVSSGAVRTSAVMPQPEGRFRRATLRFGHPYAVVATTRAQRRDPWRGVPVFAAWVADPDEAQ